MIHQSRKQNKVNSPAPQKAERKELLEQLGDCLGGLQKCVACPYADNSSLDSWPTIKKLQYLTALVEQLGKSIGIKKADSEHLNAVMHHIE